MPVQAHRQEGVGLRLRALQLCDFMALAWGFRVYLNPKPEIQNPNP